MLRIDEADLDALKEIAKTERSTVSQVIRQILAKAIEKRQGE